MDMGNQTIKILLKAHDKLEIFVTFSFANEEEFIQKTNANGFGLHLRGEKLQINNGDDTINFVAGEILAVNDALCIFSNPIYRVGLSRKGLFVPWKQIRNEGKPEEILCV